jgi:hypothetical protein
MLTDKPSTKRIPGYCSLCVSRCGSIASIENGRFIALEPNPSHPTGKALCAKWQACPDLDARGYDPFASNGANFNLIIGNEVIDPISGSVPHRAYLCQVRRAV